MASVSKVLHVPKAASDPEAWYLRSGVSPHFVPSADGPGVPAVLKGVMDDGAHDAGSGIGAVRDAAPQTRLSGFQIHAQHAHVLPASPHADPNAPVIVPVEVVVTAEFRRPPELPEANTQGAYPDFHRFRLSGSPDVPARAGPRPSVQRRRRATQGISVQVPGINRSLAVLVPRPSPSPQGPADRAINPGDQGRLTVTRGEVTPLVRQGTGPNGADFQVGGTTFYAPGWELGLHDAAAPCGLAAGPARPAAGVVPPAIAARSLAGRCAR